MEESGRWVCLFNLKFILFRYIRRNKNTKTSYQNGLGSYHLGLGLFITAIFAILTPILARTHVKLLVLARVIQGLGEVTVAKPFSAVQVIHVLQYSFIYYQIFVHVRA